MENQLIKMEKIKSTKKIEKEKAEIICNDKDCPKHGSLKTRGRTFKGIVVSKNQKRIAIKFEKMNYERKYERFSKSKVKIHARLPKCMEKRIKIGDLIRIQECRPLSKIIHFVVIEKIKEGDEKKWKQ